MPVAEGVLTPAMLGTVARYRQGRQPEVAGRLFG